MVIDYLILSNYAYYAYFLVANLCYSRATFWPRTPPFFGLQTKKLSTISNEIRHYVPTFLLLCSKVSRLGDILFWESTNFFSPTEIFC